MGVSNVFLIIILLIFKTTGLPFEVYPLSFLLLNLLFVYYFYFKESDTYKTTKYGSHGTAKWQSKKEIKQNYKPFAYGFVIGSLKDEKFDINSEYNIIKAIDDNVNNQFLVIGPPGTGKTTGFIFPNIEYLSSNKKPDLIITDPKGEIYSIKAGELRKKGYDVYVLDFFDFDKSDKINIFDYVYDEEDVLKIATGITESLYEGESMTGNSGFWKDSLKNVLICTIGYLYHGKKAGYIDTYSFSDVLDRVNVDFFQKETKAFVALGGITAEAYFTIQSSLRSPETFANIMVTCRTKLNIFGLDKLKNMLTESTIPIEQFGVQVNDKVDTEKTEKLKNILEKLKIKKAEINRRYSEIKEKQRISESTKEITVYEKKAEKYVLLMKDVNNSINIITQKLKAQKNIKTKPYALMIKIRDDDTSYQAVTNLIISTMLRTLYNTSRKTGENGVALKQDVVMLLDEFCLIGTLKEITDKLGGMRARHIYPVMIVQSLAQLKEKYPKSFQNIISQCDNKIILGVNDTETGKEIVTMLGNTTIKVNNMSKRKRKLDPIQLNNDINLSENYTGRQLLMLSELMTLKINEGILIQSHKNPVKFHKTQDKYWEIDTKKYKNKGGTDHGKSKNTIKHSYHRH